MEKENLLYFDADYWTGHIFKIKSKSMRPEKRCMQCTKVDRENYKIALEMWGEINWYINL